MAGINPFQPNSIVAPGMFAGRFEELQKLESQLIQTKGGNPTNFLIKGERGIGKSSLLLYIQWLAEGKITFSGETFQFLVINVSIEKTTTQLDFIRSIQLNLEHQLSKTAPAMEFLNNVWKFMQRIEVAGVGLKSESISISAPELVERFVYSIGETASKLCDKSEGPKLFSASFDGILLLIDEADNASADLDIGTFLKLTTEKLQKLGVNHIMVGLAGLDDLPDVLERSHASSLRMFDIIHLGRLSNKEVSQVIDNALDIAKDKNKIETTINSEAKDNLVLFSEGFPHFIQQFGYSAFDKDQDNVIDEQDVGRGATEAWEKIGERYYRTNFYNKIRKESYRQVLRIMADNLDGWVSKKTIKSKFKGGATTLNNAIAALRERGIIISKEGTSGVYKLQHKAFAVWIKVYTKEGD